MSGKSIILSDATTIVEGDFTQRDLDKIEEFKSEGLPGIAEIDEVKYANLYNLYLSGQTYVQISQKTRVPKNAIMFLSQKNTWFELRKEYLTDMQVHMEKRIAEEQIRAQEFMLDITNFYRNKIGKHMNRYLATGNEEFAEKVDFKEVQGFMKAIEMLKQLSNDMKNGQGQLQSGQVSPVGLNLGEEGVTIEKTADGKVEITPKNKSMKEALKKLSEMRKQEENK